MKTRVDGVPLERLNPVDHLSYYGIWVLRVPVIPWDGFADEDERDLHIGCTHEYYVGFPQLKARCSHVRALAYHPLGRLDAITIDFLYSGSFMSLKRPVVREFFDEWAKMVEEWSIDEKQGDVRIEREQALSVIERFDAVGDLAERIKSLNGERRYPIARIDVEYLGERVNVEFDFDCNEFWANFVMKHVLRS